MGKLARLRFQESFRTKGPVFLPVVHAFDAEQTIRNIGRTSAANAHGVFIINHGEVTPRQLLDIYNEARNEFPKLWMGVNLLGYELMDALEAFPKDAAALWTDGSGINESSASADLCASVFKSVWRRRHLNGSLWFGGVAFKYQTQVKDTAAFVRLAARHMDVLTTSGDGTGKAPEPAKLRTIVEAADGVPVVNAGGTTLDNVSELLLTGIDGALVATGVSDSFRELNLERTGLMAELFRTSGG